MRSDGYRGRHRSIGWPASAGSQRRLMTLVVVAGVALAGSGALAATMSGGPSGPPAGAAGGSGQTTGPPSVPATPGPGLPTPSPSPSPSPTRSPIPVDLTFEAELAELSGFVRIFQVEDASSGEVVGMIGRGDANHVRFPRVTVGQAGEYQLTLYYLSAVSRDAVVVVNNGSSVTVECPALGDRNEVGSVSVTVALTVGENAIWFGNPSGPGPALDRITITGSG